jgi:hypothetical protein
MWFVYVGIGAVNVLWCALALVSMRARWRRKALAATSTPLVRIADALSGGRARIAGVVKSGPTIAAPLSGRPCVCFEIAIREPRRGDRWETVLIERGGVPFVIEDAGGRALVDPQGASLMLTHSESTGDDGDEHPAALDPIFVRAGIPPDRRARAVCCESAVAIGDPVAVAGTGVAEPDPDGGAPAAAYRDAPAVRLRFATTTRASLMISNDPAFAR